MSFPYEVHDKHGLHISRLAAVGCYARRTFYFVVEVCKRRFLVLLSLMNELFIRPGPERSTARFESPLIKL
jgi:hypothetical protein